MTIKDTVHDLHVHITYTLYTFGLLLPVKVRRLQGKHVCSCICSSNKRVILLVVQNSCAPVAVGSLSQFLMFFIWFHTSQVVVLDFSHQQFHTYSSGHGKP